MPRRSQIRFSLAPVALLALLVFASTLGSIWHHHTGASDANCSFCQVSHQPIEPAHASGGETVLVLVGLRVEAPPPLFLPAPDTRQLSARAPPAV